MYFFFFTVEVPINTLVIGRTRMPMEKQQGQYPRLNKIDDRIKLGKNSQHLEELW